MLKYIACVLTVAVAISAYDFQDADFNNFLFEDLRDLTHVDGAASLARQRRDTEAPKEKECGGDRHGDEKKDWQCCTGDKFNHEKSDAFKKTQQQCHTEVRGNNADDIVDPFDCAKMQLVKQQIVCMSDCVSRKFGVIDESGALNREAILKEVRAKIGDTKWKQDAVEKYVDQCIAETKGKSGGAEVATTSADGAKQCNAQSLDFHHCIWREFLTGCPADLRVDSPKCNKIRERLVKGDTAYLNKRLLHHFHHSRPEE